MGIVRWNPQIMTWVTAFASCAIEGNRTAQRMLDLWEHDRDKFLKELKKWLK